MDSYFNMMVTECLNKRREDRNAALPRPTQPIITNRSTAIDFNNSREWRNWMETKNMMAERIRKDPANARWAYYSNEENYAGGRGLLRTYKDTANTSTSSNMLLTVNCKVCMNYMMVMQEIKACPKCGGGLVRFEQERCF
ncbi:uncharacterized protein A4U43_C01F1830 [Asparagus officinalis]|uniref:Uncharacterized protein n=1 Tax=Asparagus officinalis TaxID=4686 RepID=A0A5P1FPT5_ASPOF|nr:uncharacterized protein A4U43_C01F1830 [Asparagus officinalis]